MDEAAPAPAARVRRSVVAEPADDIGPCGRIALGRYRSRPEPPLMHGTDRDHERERRERCDIARADASFDDATRRIDGLDDQPAPAQPLELVAPGRPRPDAH